MIAHRLPCKARDINAFRECPECSDEIIDTLLPTILLKVSTMRE